MRTGRPQDPPVSPLLWIFGGLFSLSGALGLAYEVLWLRKLLLIFGNTVYASSAVLTVFFGGVGLGSWWGGWWSERRPERGLWAYAWLEIIIGLYALITPELFQIIERIYIPIYRASGLSPAVFLSASFVCTTAILLLPTMCLGATFPLLVRGVRKAKSASSSVTALFYGLNTLGAMAGTAGVYYVALQRLGWLASVQCAGLLNLVVGTSAWILSRRVQHVGVSARSQASEEHPDALPATMPASQPPIRGLLLVFGISGFAALSYEVAWTRALSLVVGSSIYAFCLMLTTFLGGLAVGGLLGRWWLTRRAATGQQLVVVELALAVCGLASIVEFQWLPEWFVRLMPLVGISFNGMTALQLVLSMGVMALPAIGFGFLFPLFLDMFTEGQPRWGHRLGVAYAVNTLGGILGSFLCGFWLVPTVGLAWTIAIAALANLAAALLVYGRISRAALPVRWAMAGATALLWVGAAAWQIVPSWNRAVMSAGAYLSPSTYERTSVAALQQQYDLLFYRESVNSTVSVHRTKRNPQELFLKIGGKADASTGIDMGTQILLAQVPLLLRPESRDVLVIGLGSGVTVGSVVRHPVERVDVAEVDPAVAEAARYFAVANSHALDDPRVHVHVADGRNFLLATPRDYDLIISEPSNPWMAGIATLFTEEFYEHAKRRLRPGGLMCQWFHLYHMFPSDVKLVLRTFQQVFPYVSVWSSIPGDVLLVGSDQPYQVSYEVFRQRFAQPMVREDVARMHLTDPRVLLELCWLGPSEVRRVCANAPGLHRDDLPWLEFDAPKALHDVPAFRVNYLGLRQFKTLPRAVVPDVPPAPEESAYYAALGEVYQYRREFEPAAQALERAVALDPANRGASAALEQVDTQLNRDVKMRRSLEESIALNHTNLQLYRLLARLLRQQGQLEESWRVYARAAAVRVPDAEFAADMASVLRKLQRVVEASECLRSARSQDAHERPELVVALAQTLNELRRWDDAAQLLRAALSRHPNEPTLLLLLAHARMAQGHHDEARTLFERVAALAPLPEAYFGLGVLARQQGDVRQATEWMMTGLRFDPYNVKALEILAELQELSHG